MTVIMYVKPGCPYCQRAREQLAAEGTDHRGARRDAEPGLAGRADGLHEQPRRRADDRPRRRLRRPGRFPTGSRLTGALSGRSAAGVSGSELSAGAQVVIPVPRRRRAITVITSCAKYGVSWTRIQKCRAGISTSTASSAATAAASDRGSSWINASSPNKPGAVTVSIRRSPSLTSLSPRARHT